MSSTSQHPQHWTSRWFSRLKPGAAARRARSLDFADYGTAFGLDLSLAGSADAVPKAPVPVETEPERSAAAVVAAEPKSGRSR